MKIKISSEKGRKTNVVCELHLCQAQRDLEKHYGGVCKVVTRGDHHTTTVRAWLWCGTEVWQYEELSTVARRD